jgi:hypothetical protein
MSTKDIVQPFRVTFRETFRQIYQLDSNACNEVIVRLELLGVEKIERQGMQSSARLEKSVQDSCSLNCRKSRNVENRGKFETRHN